MARIPFRLQSVLSYRESLVDQLGRQLALLQTEREGQRRALQALLAEREVTLDRRQRRQAAGLDVGYVARFSAYMEHLRGRVQQQLAVIAHLDERIAAKRQQLTEALEQKEMLLKLKERHRREAVAEWERREATWHDEIAISQYVRQRRNGGAAI